MTKQKYLLPIFALAFANILWGINTPLIKMGVESIPVPIFMSIRFLIASLILLPFALHSWKPLKRKDYSLLILSSILFISISALALNIGLTKTTASNAAIIWLLGPILVFILSVAFLQERLSIKTLLGILVALIGTLVIIGRPWVRADNSAQLAGNLLIVLALICEVLSIAIFKPMMKKMSSYQATFMSLFPGIVPIALYATTQLSDWNMQTTTAASLSALVASTVVLVLANFFFFYALKYKLLQSTGVYRYLDAAAAVLGAWFLLAERPSPTFFTGAALVLIGVYIVESKMRSQKAP